MRIENFTITHTKQFTRFSADFIFQVALGSRSDRYRAYLRNVSLLFSRPMWFIQNWKSTTQTIWFSIPTQKIQDVQAEDAFFIVAIGLAIFLNEDLFFDGIVSQELIDKMPALRKYFDYGLARRKIKITYRVGKHLSIKRAGIAQFFTLGVDSFATLLLHSKPNHTQKRDLIYVDGYDVPLEHAKFLQGIHSRIKRVAKETGNSTVFVSTNLREVSDKIIGWGQYHVSALVAIGQLLSYQKIYISGESFDWPDWGLRSGVDQLFSTSELQFQVVGHNRRRDLTIKQLQKSAHFSLFLDHVRTCWINVQQTPIPYNCSVCQKCLRTKLTLFALGVKKTPTFQKLDISALENIALNPHVYQEWKVLHTLLQKKETSNSPLVLAIEALFKKPMVKIPPAYRTVSV